MEKIINLTQHASTPEQREAGVVDLPEKSLAEVRKLLTFNSIPTAFEMWGRATAIAEIAEKEGAKKAMIGGPPYFIVSLEKALSWKGIESLYAFSIRESKEVQKKDGSVEKINVFRHAGFVEGTINR